ncbi:metal ABC transporter substrate-binding protein [Actinoplanes teichomyceticus]|uniref:Manganese ABC transporter n=1 Tax=Actinoplanes teichomyceticus TaxID=1867 RepID=Q6ZZF9_ACTTI|nr:metal ABC transporter substrate-binding protein [Actinoplanes teichomyceticus]TWG09439.1 zinc/manganese transport system substrate-binding protein [Actinoplanes teichomyceticus]GIF17086.1 ABC transporter substrate-binding protein [Actinoplanes teichomyceticus]CAG15046.1 manganese ABC transporter [Actinoplanes teichomyceticus]
MDRQRIFRAAATAAALTVIAGCGSGTPDEGGAAAGGAALAVVATTPEVADFVRNVGGADVAVTQIIKPNVDPHDYEPTPADLQAIASAKVVVKSGVGLEEWLDRTIESAGFRGAVVDSSRGVTLREGHEDEGAAGGHEGEDHDPHIWHDPRNAKIMVANIEAGLAAAEPGKAAAFQANLARYTAELDRLDADNEAAFARLPKDARKLVTNHDAFGYYVQRYGLEFVGSVIPSLDTSAELSGKQLTDLVAKIKATGAKAVFAESSLPPKTAEALARQAGVEVVAGEDALFGDSLGEPGTPEGTYLGAERHNTQVIVTALAG